MISIRLFYHPDNPGQELDELLKQVEDDYDFELTRVDVTSNEDLLDLYGSKVPFLDIGPYRLHLPTDLKNLHKTLGAQQDRLKVVDQVKKNGFGTADKISYWISRNFILVVMLFLLGYSGLPVLAPVLMKLGLEGLAKPIYSLYSPLCHQFAHRSFFLYGEQSVYPAEAAGLDGLETFEEISGQEHISILGSKEFLGDEVVGYKMALCERDVAIYGAMFLFGLVFLASGRRIKAPHFAVWVILGIGPIALDGGTQLISQWIDLPFLPYRESIPLFRVATGAIFGLVTGWLGFPLLEEGMRETRQAFAVKQARAADSAEN